MSYANRFTNLVLKQKQKQSNQSGNGRNHGTGSGTSAKKGTQQVVCSSRNSSTSPVRVNKVGGTATMASPYTPSTKPLSVVPCVSTVSTSRRRSCSISDASKPCLPITPSSSDDYSTMLVLKKKIPSRSMPPQALNKYSTPHARTMLYSKKDVIAKTNERRNESSKLQKSASVGVGSNNVVHEGPMKIPSDMSGLCKILSEPSAWKTEEDESRMHIDFSDSTTDLKEELKDEFPSQFATTKTKVPPASSYTVMKGSRHHSLGAMGTMRQYVNTGTPSDTDKIIPGDDNQDQDLSGRSIKMENMKADFNNNTVLQTIKNTFFGSFGFGTANALGTQHYSLINVGNPAKVLADAATSSTLVVNEEDKEKNAHEDLNTSKNSLSNSKSLVQVNSKCEETILESSYNDVLDWNDSPQNSNSTYGIYLRGSDSILIPLEIEEQLHRVFQLQNKSREGQIYLDENHNHHPKLNHNSSYQRQFESSRPGNDSREEVDMRGSECCGVPSPLKKLAFDTWAQVNSPNGEDKEEIKEEEPFHGSKCISPNSSHVAANPAPDEFTYPGETSLNVVEAVDCQQQQIKEMDLQDDETVPESIMKLDDIEEKKKKLMSLVMVVNAGVNINPTSSPSTPNTTDPKKKSVRLKGIMKETRPLSARPTSNATKATRKTSSLSALTEVKKRRRSSQEKKASVSYPKKLTFAQVGADYGFPSDISVSSFMESVMGLKWASPKTEDDDKDGEENEIKSEEYNEMNNAVVIACKDEKRIGGGGGEEGGLINKAYDIFSAGLKFASGLIGDETELELREDLIRYNGYIVKVRGQKLLLESLHVNCDFHPESNVNYNHSAHAIALKPHTMSREKLEGSCDGRRIRIVVRLNGPSPSSSSTHLLKDEILNAIIHGEKHRVRMEEGKWTLIYGEVGDNKGNKKNFVEITCPTGVHPESLAYGVSNGLLFIDAP